MSPPLRILFYYNSPVGLGSINLGTAHLYLKTYLDVTAPDIAKQLIWLMPEQRHLSDDDLVKICIANDVDILCTSHYIWNHDALMKQLAVVKSQLPKTIIVVGGPSIEVNIDPQWFDRYPFVDYAIYAAGESAFCDLITALISHKSLNPELTSNMGWRDPISSKKKLAPYRYVPVTKVSPYLHNRQLFLDMAKKINHSGLDITLPYELTRGCPYACTFCDYNSGLSRKVSRRKATYQDEIDLFYEANIRRIFLSDANVGQFDEDVDMIAYLAEKNLAHGSPVTIFGNYSKLRIKNNLKIYHLLAKGKLLDQGFTISCNEVNDDILKNIDRPDISWQEHSRVIDELHACYPRIPCQVQLLQGLPGQTPDTWRETLRVIAQKPVMLIAFVNEWLVNSPAATDKTYQEKWQFVYSNSERLQTAYLGQDNKFFRGYFPESCVSFTKSDFVDMTLMLHIYAAICQVKFHVQADHTEFPTENVIDSFQHSRRYQILRKNLAQNWENDRFYYTINFDGSSRMISACQCWTPATEWSQTRAFRDFLRPFITDPKVLNRFNKTEKFPFWDHERKFYYDD